MALQFAINEFKVGVDSFDEWCERLEQLFVVNEVDNNERKTAIMITLMGKTAYALLKSICEPAKPTDKTFKQLVKLMQNHCELPKPVFAERYIFFNATQHTSETSAEWLARVKNLSRNCKFAGTVEAMIRDKFVVGLRKGPILDKLLQENETLSVAKAFNVAASMEASQNTPASSKFISHRGAGAPESSETSSAKSTVAEVKTELDEVELNKMSISRKSVGQQTPKKKHNCEVCGKIHSGKCRYSNYVCNSCKSKGHLAVVCKTRYKRYNKNNQNYLQSTEEQELTMFTLNINDNTEPIYINVDLNNISVKMELDTGATMSVISKDFYEQYFSSVPLQTNNTIFRTYDGKVIKPCGKCKLNVTYKGQSKEMCVYVINNGGPPLLGRNWAHLFEIPLINLKYCADNDSIPTQPWERIHVDFAGPIYNKTFLIIIDSYTKWPEVFEMHSTVSTKVIDKLCAVFGRFGLPKVLVSDNGPQFTSVEFQKFLAGNGIIHKLSPPFHAASNGAAENFVKTFKNAFIKAVKDIKNLNSVHNKIQKFLFDYRNVEHCTTNECPALLMFGRKLRCRFDLLQPSLINQVIEKQNKQIENKRGKRLDKFELNELVWVKDYRDQTKTLWTKAKILKILGPRTYLVNVNELIWKRHLNQIQKYVHRHSSKNVDTVETEQVANSDLESESVSPKEIRLQRNKKPPDWYRPN